MHDLLPNQLYVHSTDVENGYCLFVLAYPPFLESYFRILSSYSPVWFSFNSSQSGYTIIDETEAIEHTKHRLQDGVALSKPCYIELPAEDKDMLVTQLTVLGFVPNYSGQMNTPIKKISELYQFQQKSR